jgi:hypothetical protein
VYRWRSKHSRFKLLLNCTVLLKFPCPQDDVVLTPPPPECETITPKRPVAALQRKVLVPSTAPQLAVASGEPQLATVSSAPQLAVASCTPQLARADITPRQMRPGVGNAPRNPAGPPRGQKRNRTDEFS